MGEPTDALPPRSLPAWRAEALGQVRALEPIDLSLLDALGQVIAEDVVTTEPDAHGDALRVPSGRRLRVGDLGVLMAVGRRRVAAHPPPRVAGVAVRPARGARDAGARDAQAREGAPDAAEATSLLLAALAREADARAPRLEPVPGEPREVAGAVEDAAAHSDLIVLAAGVPAPTVGDLARALNGAGRIRAADVAVHPGSEQGFGLVETEPDRPVPLLVIPADPLGAVVAFEVLARPAIRLLQGRRDLNRARVPAVLETPLDSVVGSVGVLPVTLTRQEGIWRARPAPSGGVHEVAPLASAHGLAEIPAELGRREADETVLVHLLVDPG